MHRPLAACVVCAFLASLMSCKPSAPLAPLAPPDAATAVAPQPTEDPNLSSISGKSDPDCVGPIELDIPTKVKVGRFAAIQNGYRLTFERPLNSPELTLGVIANTKDDTADNLVMLEKYLAWFKEKRVDAIVFAGDIGERPRAIERILSAIARSGLPLFAITGNREGKREYREGFDAARKHHANLVDLTQVRLVELGAATLISLPGYHDPRFLHSETGCQYFREDAEALVTLAGEAKAPVVLVSHGPPRGATREAIDYAGQAGNVGDANLNEAITKGKIPFGIFANIHEGGGKATDLTGAKVIAEGIPSAVLYLNPGPADTVRWVLNNGGESRGMVATLRISNAPASPPPVAGQSPAPSGPTASYEVYRASATPAPTHRR